MSKIDQYNRQNKWIFVVLQSVLIALLWFASQLSGWSLLFAALPFSFLGLTNYALIHEACHGCLHTKKRYNDLMGCTASWLFPVSFSFMSVAHKVHHINNRTDNEMFDYYYPDDNLLLKYAQWYSILIGIYPPIIPVGSIIMACTPWIFWLKPWQTAKSSSIIFDQTLFTAEVLRKIRLEVVLGICFWLLLFFVLDLDLFSVSILYIAFWFNWSTRQYVTHAFSKRDVLQGAYNLKVSQLMACIFLNGHWDLVHHNYPNARWQELPEMGTKSREPIAYWPQYFKQWLGPRKNKEIAPAAMKDIY
ncbi:MAG: fatty acid desaturase [Gammaproteobacteria bacterium]|nr:fatty acid desaturase [Gammaproteobacteria bacterium]